MNTQTTATKPAKWFYPIQDEIRKAMTAHGLEPLGYCILQEATGDFYLEQWHCTAENETASVYTFICYRENRHLFIHKSFGTYLIGK